MKKKKVLKLYEVIGPGISLSTRVIVQAYTKAKAIKMARYYMVGLCESGNMEVTFLCNHFSEEGIIYENNGDY